MLENLKKLKKNAGEDVLVLLVLAILLLGSIGDIIDTVVEYCQKEESAYEMRMVSSDDTSYYAIFIDGEELDKVDYNEYAVTDAEGNINIKDRLIINQIYELILYVFATIISLAAYRAFYRIRKMKSPFRKEGVTCLRIVAIMTILLGMIPEAIRSLAIMFVYAEYEGTLVPTENAIVVFLGIIFGIISEIFRYGCELQDDIDQIA